jgi:HTH-type transcriptional regulator / antitoxin HigA
LIEAVARADKQNPWGVCRPRRREGAQFIVREFLDASAIWVEELECNAYLISYARPHEVLQFLMEQRNLKQFDLVPNLGSRGYVSDTVNGKRGISKEHAKALGEFFHVSPELFI